MSANTRKASKGPCPYLKKPFPACFCAQLGTATIDDATRYCLGNYQRCEIFRNHADDLATAC